MYDCITPEPLATYIVSPTERWLPRLARSVGGLKAILTTLRINLGSESEVPGASEWHTWGHRVAAHAALILIRAVAYALRVRVRVRVRVRECVLVRERVRVRVRVRMRVCVCACLLETRIRGKPARYT